MGQNTDVLSKNSLKKFQGKRIIFFSNFLRPRENLKFTRKSVKTPKIGEKCKNDEFVFLFKTHPYFAPFSPKKLLSTCLV